MEGLGDLIKVATDAVGIKQCGGCAERQKKLNVAVPFDIDKVVKRMTESSIMYRKNKGDIEK